VGSMQEYALTVDKFLVHAARWHGSVEVVSADPGGVTRKTYADIRDRANRRLSGALLDLGLRPGEHRNPGLEHPAPSRGLVRAMGVGMVCHTLNPRLTDGSSGGSMIDQAEDRILASARVWRGRPGPDGRAAPAWKN
jgi:hypothetical protein